MHRPIIRDPDPVKDGDYILVESTYGDRLHDDRTDIKTAIADVINADEGRRRQYHRAELRPGAVAGASLLSSASFCGKAPSRT